MGKVFRTAVFGGFRKKDVIAYLERLSGPAGFDGSLCSREEAEAVMRVRDLESELREKEAELQSLRDSLADARQGMEEIAVQLRQSAEQAAMLERDKSCLEQQLQARAVAPAGGMPERPSMPEPPVSEEPAVEAVPHTPEEGPVCMEAADEGRLEAAEQRVRQLEAELAEQKRCCEELAGQNRDLMARQAEEAPRDGGAVPELEQLRKELARISDEVERLSRQAASAAAPAVGVRPEGEKLSSPDEILTRVALHRGKRIQ